ncbi:multidrug resistance protein, MATE family [Granulicella rosea]|uniref:Multidrug-efflux transporter n=1 Tax=Granulicella rosea TaxID=474952 RepID=A0A239L4P1_9BACT|nr:MATE family efflux transporter [Granulicella rosea]SNT25577.1 multidrug resistance protein, MATE family [Granulicella rosea]
MLHIALPLVLAEIGWMSMGVVDTIMVGHLPNAATAIGSAALAQVIYNTLAFGIGGILLGLDTTIAQAHGAGDVPAANRWLVQGVILAAGISALLMTCYALAPIGFHRLPTDPVVVAGAVGTLGALSLGTLPLMLYFTLRRYLQAFNHVRLVAAALVSSNLINLLFDWLLIYGHRWTVGGHVLAIPAGGVVGSGIATSLARTYQAVFMIASILYVNRRHGYGLLKTSWRPHWASLRRLLALGVPSGATILVEIAIFAAVTAIISTLGPAPLSGHEIALNCISFTFMVPLGISAAASIRVGQAVGRRDAAGARAAGWAAILLGAAFMLAVSVLYVTIPYALAGAFTTSATVIAATVPLLYIASIFQFCDGLQVTAIGALRGAGNTHSGLITHLCSYWLFGMPIGLYLCFTRRMGAPGLWLGLCASLIVSGLTLIYLWRRMARTLSFQ